MYIIYMARKFLRRDICRSHSTIKVAQYYFFTRDAWQDIILLGSALNFLQDSRSPAPYKQLCLLR